MGAGAAENPRRWLPAVLSFCARPERIIETAMWQRCGAAPAPRVEHLAIKADNRRSLWGEVGGRCGNPGILNLHLRCGTRALPSAKADTDAGVTAVPIRRAIFSASRGWASPAIRARPALAEAWACKKRSPKPRLSRLPGGRGNHHPVWVRSDDAVYPAHSLACMFRAVASYSASYFQKPARGHDVTADRAGMSTGLPSVSLRVLHLAARMPLPHAYVDDMVKRRGAHYSASGGW